MTPNSSLYRLKYIDNTERIGWSNFAPLPKILYRLEQLLKEGMPCIVLDELGNEYQAPEPITKPPKPIAPPKYPSPKPMMIDAIAAYLKKPENVEKRRQARLDDANQWAKLRNY